MIKIIPKFRAWDKECQMMIDSDDIRGYKYNFGYGNIYDNEYLIK